MIGFLFKGLLRDRSRSLLPLITVVVGVALMVLAHTWVSGIMNDAVEINARFASGHFKVTTRAYAEEAHLKPNDLAVLELDKVLTELRRDYPGTTWHPRISFGGLLDVPDQWGETVDQAPVAGLAADLLGRGTTEPANLNLVQALVEGGLPDRAGEVLVSHVLYQQLGLTVGQPVSLVGSTMDGAMTVANFTVAGSVNFGVQALDRGALIVDLADAQHALAMDDAAGEILGFLPYSYDPALAAELKATFNGAHADPEDPYALAMTTLEDQEGLGGLVASMNSAGIGMIGAFVAVMGIVLWNAGLRNGIRRYKEFALRLAIGESKRGLYLSMAGEALIVGLVGSAIGTALGIVPSWYLMEYGVSFAMDTSAGSVMMPTTYRALVTPTSYVIGFVPGLMATLFGSLIAGLGIFKYQTAQLLKELE